MAKNKGVASSGFLWLKTAVEIEDVQSWQPIYYV
jgi:hypothetical protein